MNEKWNEIYKDEEIKHIQRIELSSLKYFSDLCDKLNIEFYLYGGSLLGAIKYSGFVPWDDDLDIALQRKDYDKLIKLGPSLLSDEYELQHPSNNKLTPFSYIKFRRKDTSLVEFALHKIKMNHGVYFDIYPLDNLPENDEELIRQHSKFSLVSRLFYYRQVKYLSRPATNLKDLIKSVVRYGMSAILKLIPHSVFFKYIEKLMTRNNAMDSSRKGNFFHPTPFNYFEGIHPVKTVAFEDVQLKVPHGYEINLLQRYGDITKLPPENERYGHKAHIIKLN
ncbi:phosphorylcholine transferase LicD [Vibrio sp. 10N.222.51.C8]|uniref:LicD family protein n=1 Tax=Vibrio sp. 10N.222.51.C8 TaxID=3229624 RepID=UPI00354EEEE4